jgi:two-component system OmpR family sensor kinase/two-component system sensor histidine kinase BaeS
MSLSPQPHESSRLIQRRLYRLLLSAFAIVVTLTVVLLIGLLAVLANGLTRSNSTFGPPQVSELEAFYLGRRSWDGVGALIAQAESQAGPAPGPAWSNLTLLDSSGRVVVENGQVTGPRVGQPYAGGSTGPSWPLIVAGAPVGQLILSQGSFRGPGGLLPVLAAPVLIISFFTAVLTILIGILLGRRVVRPLADVIAAALQVADGDLSARAPVRGPGDLRTLSDSFNRMAEALEANDRQRRNLLADVAHELRTPLTVIRGKLEGVLDGVYPADEDHVAPVLEEVYLLERLVEDLQLLTLAETGKLHFDRQALDLADLARRTIGLFEAEAAERGIALQVTLPPALPLVLADEQRVGQVLGNLVGNALRYTPSGGQVCLSAAANGGQVALAVSDTGPGVAEVDLPHIFDRFWRGEKSRARASGGAGLGLAIARQLVEAQGGHISAANEPRGGLRVSFSLPAAR